MPIINWEYSVSFDAAAVPDAAAAPDAANVPDAPSATAGGGATAVPDAPNATAGGGVPGGEGVAGDGDAVRADDDTEAEGSGEKDAAGVVELRSVGAWRARRRTRSTRLYWIAGTFCNSLASWEVIRVSVE